MHDQASKLREMMQARDRAARPAGPVPTVAPAVRTGPAQPAWPVSPVQAAQQGESPRPATPASASPAIVRPRVLAIASGKGGVGKSMVAANLAYCIARAGRRTLLVDADLGMANLDLLLGLTPGRNLGHVVTGQADLGATLMEGPGGMLFLPGASGLARAADLSGPEREHLMADLLGLEESAELIVIDTGAGISQNVMAFAQAADEVLVVTTPEPTAMTDAYALIKVLHHNQYPGRIGVLVNQAVDRVEGRAVFGRLAKTSARFLGRTIYDLGWLPKDGQVGLAVRNRRPVVACQPAAKVSRALVALSARLLADARAVHRAHAQPGLFRRIAGLFF